MIENAMTEVPATGVCLLDDAYLAWFSAECECELALHAWSRRADSARAAAYSRYRLALEREEAAARELERAWRLAEARRSRVVQGTEGVIR
ncbi:MAG TPA: hypothetical protein VMJ65_20965 [Solirubrobacteraceae bacterium]|nr:hypothetical protein [Solirubrobacteraceae bacterium]